MKSKHNKLKTKTKRIRRGGQLKGTVHRGELRTYYELLSLLMKNDMRKSELRGKLRTDGRFMKKAMSKLSKNMFIHKIDNTRFSKYRITEIGMEFMVYLKQLEG